MLQSSSDAAKRGSARNANERNDRSHARVRRFGAGSCGVVGKEPGVGWIGGVAGGGFWYRMRGGRWRWYDISVLILVVMLETLALYSEIGVR